jgi:hypothetical protein
MASKALAHLRRQWMGALSLFLVLSGSVTYAATGDPFILGQANSASKPTRLSSGSTDTALQATNTGTGQAIAGFAENQAIYGHSNSNAGLVGESESFDGVYGTSNGSGAGVSGHNNAGGFGLWASGGSRAFNTAAIHGQSTAGNAVEGFSTADPSSGVYGQDNAASSYGVAGHSDNGVAVVGDSSSGWAMQALGQTSQTRNKSGFVKAMAFVNPDSLGVEQCFNSQRPASLATSGNCGITFNRIQAGAYRLDFHFKVDDRFLSATSTVAGQSVDAAPYTSTVISVGTWNSATGAGGDYPFFIIVY